ncbi:MAG: response regulator [Synechococcales cyanobacterium RM1_1_8]|nr:response regulator [Synechococcales cyanobacterium RM1_1_8]
MGAREIESRETGSRQILMIDDEETIQTVVKFGLQLTAGWQMLAACSGPTGIALAQQHQPDAILLDVMMPEMDGVATFKALQAAESTRHIPVIFISSVNSRLIIDSMIRQGITDYLVKPFKPEDLTAKVNSIFNGNI